MTLLSVHIEICFASMVSPFKIQNSTIQKQSHTGSIQSIHSKQKIKNEFDWIIYTDPAAEQTDAQKSSLVCFPKSGDSKPLLGGHLFIFSI